MTQQLLLLFDQKANRQLLTGWLGRHYDISIAESDVALDQPHDLVLLDGPALARLNKQIRARKEAEQPVFLPVLLVTPQQDIGLAQRHLWQSVDELVVSPVEKLVLQARVETLLRARRLSTQLKRFSEDQEAFIHAMTHDLRAPLRAVVGYTGALIEDYEDEQDGESRHLLHRVKSAAGDMQLLLDSLLDFSRLGRNEIHLQPVPLAMIIESCLVSLQDDIRQASADVVVPDDLPTLQAHPTLLNVAFTNLISNALKYVPPDRSPRVEVGAEVMGKRCITHVRDNGIGISPEDQERIFEPFTRLHGVEEFPGVGLGLPTVRKAVELMDGRISITSSAGQGSVFWIELNLA